MTMELCFEIQVKSVLGVQFTQKVFPFDTVADLKAQLSKKTSLEMHKLALVFCGQELLDNTAQLSSFGIKAKSTLGLVVMARSGPSRRFVQPETSRVDSLVLSETERSRRGCSATEDTSAKESSAGELTEHDEIDKQNRLTRLAEAVYSGRHSRRQRGSSISTGKTTEQGHKEETIAGEILVEISDKPSGSQSAEDEEAEEPGIQEECLPRPESSDGLLNASDPSELSSGMIICDLTMSNEFRKLKVRRRHHLPVVGRARSRPRIHTGSSSDEREGDNDPVVDVQVLNSLSGRRPVPTQKTRQLPIKSTAQLRCSVCAFKTNITFNCRCGKFLCPKHRGSHPCTRAGRRIQQVSE
ncbi:unnamed protein product, partial [Mesorhabditis belari]|uniref:Ubiquitin-like domain-containing protein n=1 Tax=Mesorhabditis belari TaxID=2138241 RepID=A0AAF3FFD3_9BILA